jgi:hypothetical protein
MSYAVISSQSVQAEICSILGTYIAAKLLLAGVVDCINVPGEVIKSREDPFT